MDTVANRKKGWRVGSILRVSKTRKEASALQSYCKPWQGFGVPQPGELAAMPSKWGLLFLGSVAIRIAVRTQSYEEAMLFCSSHVWLLLKRYVVR